MKLRSLEELKDIVGKKVFVRADLDAPLSEDPGGQFKVADDKRLKANLATLEYLVKAGARVVVAGQVGRPYGKVELSKSTKPMANFYAEYFPKLEWLGDCTGPEVVSKVGNLSAGKIVILENLRFHQGEEENDPIFAQDLAALADFYVNENFSNSHRNHASMVRLAELRPAFAGFNLIKEVTILSEVLENSAPPLMVVIGGSKVETKLPVIKNFLDKAERVFVGGLTGCQTEVLKDLGEKVCFACGDPDLSFATAKAWGLELLAAKTIIWNGPMGDTSGNQLVGSELIARAVVEATQAGAKSIVGGGDTEDFLSRLGLEKDISFISTGGGAMLDFLAGLDLPALRPLLVND